MSDVYIVVIDSTNEAYERLSEGVANVTLLARDLREETAIRWAESIPDHALPPVSEDGREGNPR